MRLSDIWIWRKEIRTNIDYSAVEPEVAESFLTLPIAFVIYLVATGAIIRTTSDVIYAGRRRWSAPRWSRASSSSDESCCSIIQSCLRYGVDSFKRVVFFGITSFCGIPFITLLLVVGVC